jgi:hypothetical protein
MTNRVLRLTGAGGVSLLIALAALIGCRSYHVQISVENRTGAAIQLLEVDYPSASFGADSLASGGSLNYSIQVRGSGPVKVQYSLAGVAQKQISGPPLSEGDEGQLQIVLLPGNKVEFTPQFSHGH